MKLIIAGSRTIEPSIHLLHSLISQLTLKPTEIVSGGAEGVDRCAKKLTDNFIGSAYYDKLFYEKYKEFPADWKTHGKAAGPIRNKQMAEYADALLLIWDGESRGSASMKNEMIKLGKPMYEVIIKRTNVV